MTSPFLHALSCSKCGAALEAQPGQQVVTCGYCRQSHVFVPPPPAERPGTAYTPGEAVAVEWGGHWWPATVLGAVGDHEWKIHFDGWGSEHDTVVGPSRIRHRSAATRPRRSGAALPVAVAGILVLVAGGAAYVAAAGAGRGTSPATAPGPGVATATYAAGEECDIWDGGRWWPGRVKSVSAAGYLVSFDGYSSTWDKTVDATMLRPRAVAPEGASRPTAPASGDPKAKYRAGQTVDIHWGSSWWPGRVVAVTGDRYRITYDGWSSAHDETVDATRLRARK